MARCPFAAWRPLPQNLRQSNQNSDIQVIFHTLAGGTIDANWKYMAAGSAGRGTESHFLVGYDGRIIQGLDTTSRGDANAAANRTAVAIETEGTGSEPWTPGQLFALTRLGRWLLSVHPTIAKRACRTPTDPGFSYHSRFEEWNPHQHSCPGSKRITQFPALLKAIITTPPKDGDMTVEELDAYLASPQGKKRLVAAILAYKNPHVDQDHDVYSHIVKAGEAAGNVPNPAP